MIKTIAAIFLGKIIFFLSRTLKLGGGFAATGLYALKIDPDLVEHLASQINQQIIITGTNGKTTTSGMLSTLYHASGIKVLRNKTGSNLERGIASVLIRHSSIFGKINEPVAIWEVDEAAFNILAPKLKPDLIVFLNVYRDQLDRYGEVDSIVKKWAKTLDKLPKRTKLLINSDDGSLKPLIDSDLKTFFYALDNAKIKSEKNSVLNKTPDFSGSEIKNNGISDTQFTFKSKKAKHEVKLKIAGSYNIYNGVAALSAKALGSNLTEDNIASLVSFKPEFGRNEPYRAGSKEGLISLIKNPTGATEVLKTIVPELKKDDGLLIILNDNFADGKDVSWIWDISFENYNLQPKTYNLFISGTRAYDLALRMKYSGIKDFQVVDNLEESFSKALKETSGKLFILPTYTALLSLQKIMVKKGIKKEYWKE